MAKDKTAKKKAAKKKTSAKKQVAKKQSTEVALNVNYDGDVGRGLEGTDKDSFAIPFLRVLQKGSPQVDEDDPLYIKGAKPGMFFNTLTSETFNGKKGVVVYPCYFERRFIHWGPKGGENGGYKGDMTPEDAAKMEQSGKIKRVDNTLYFPDGKGKVKENKCDTLADTRNHYCLLFNEDTGEVQQILLSLASTQIKKSKQLVSLLANVRVDNDGERVAPPTWANKVRVTTIPESNDFGSWHGVDFELDGFVESQAVYDAGKVANEIFASGDVNVNYNNSDGAEAEEF